MRNIRWGTMAMILLVCVSTLTAGTRTRAVAKPTAQQVIEVAAAQKASLTKVYTESDLYKGVYVGSEFCLACHPAYSAWRDTKHANALQKPLGANSLKAKAGVVADYDNNGVDDFKQGLDFNQIPSVFDPYKPNAPVLSYEAASDTYFITIGQVKMPVVVLQGGTGNWKQRYLVRIPTSDAGLSQENYLSPIQYNESSRKYVLYKDTSWWDATTKQPRIQPGMSVAMIASTTTSLSYSKNCIGCHTTGIKSLGRNESGEWKYEGFPAVLYANDDASYVDWDRNGMADLVNVGCESCHGAGSQHIISAGRKDKIVNPAKLSAEKANEVCGNCHGRYASLPNGTHEFPYDETTKTSFVPGGTVPLTSFVKSAAGRWPDGRSSKQHHQQYDDFNKSVKPTFQFHPVTCFECHDPHGGTGNNAQLVKSLPGGAGVEIPTRANDNTLCLGCHAGFGPFDKLTKAQIAKFEENVETIGKVVSAHTHHPYAPDRKMGLSRCTSCHMPLVVQTANAYDIRSHTFEVIPPEKTIKYQSDKGMPNACAGCHGMSVNVFGFGLNPSLSTWNDSFDVMTAEKLSFYFGPNGIWWNTTAAHSRTAQSMATDAKPGTVPVETLQDN